VLHYQKLGVASKVGGVGLSVFRRGASHEVGPASEK
jgi:hypothetical protein